MSIIQEQARNLVDQYFSLLSLEASQSQEEFWEYLYDKHGSLADAVSKEMDRRTRDNQDEFYKIKNQNLQLSLDFAKLIADFHKQYCLWFASREQKQPERLLDIGCDNGILTCFYAYLYPDTEVYGIDISEAGVRCARELAEKLGVTNVTFEVLAFEELNHAYPARYFDMVTSVRCLHEVMGTIPFPINWSLQEYLDKFPIGSDPRYVEIIQKLVAEDGEYISSERWENPAALGQWANVLREVGLYLQWKDSGFIEFHETGTHHKMPVIVTNQTDTGLKTMEGIQVLYTDHIELDAKVNTSYRSVAAEMMYNSFTDKELQSGYFLAFHRHWYKMRFEIWRAGDSLLVYGSGNMGYRQLEIVPVGAEGEASEKVKQMLQQYAEHGEVHSYLTLEERMMLE